jgi:hypothetical protein
MNRIILIILLLFSCLGFSQKKVTLDELKLNINCTQPTTLIKFNPKMGFGLGIYHKFRKEKVTNFLIGLEYNYTNYSGATLKTYGSGEPIRQNINIDYHSVTFPIKFKINASKLFYTKLGLLLDFNFLVKEKGVEYKNGGSTNYNKTGHYYTPTLGLDFGIGFNFYKSLFTSLGYSYFINNGNIYQRVSSFNLSLGIKF